MITPEPVRRIEDLVGPREVAEPKPEPMVFTEEEIEQAVLEAAGRPRDAISNQNWKRLKRAMRRRIRLDGHRVAE